MAMNNLFYLCSVLFFLNSCNKENIPDANLEGKLKEIISYALNDSTKNILRQYFTYDTKTGNLIKIQTDAKINGHFIEEFGLATFKKLDEQNILYENLQFGKSNPDKYIINHINLQIKEIILKNAANNNLVVTNVYHTNDYDSIVDLGIFPYFDMEVHNFKFENGNCITYNITAQYMYMIFPAPISVFDTIEYSNFINNTYDLALQNIGVNSISGYTSYCYYDKVLSNASFYGLHLIKNNKNLISKIYANDKYNLFNYEFNSKNKVSKVIITENDTIEPTIKEYIYY